ncbi:hypothetical protein Lal_00033805 [Lupinus albus]|nr:hypothetical protein Lal_00033805 [Lupinus albus]
MGRIFSLEREKARLSENRRFLFKIEIPNTFRREGSIFKNKGSWKSSRSLRRDPKVGGGSEGNLIQEVSERICKRLNQEGQMRYSCSTYLKKVEHDKKDSRDIKIKKTYIIWDVPEEDTTSSTSKDEKSIQLCLMVQTHNSCRISEMDKFSEVSSSNSSSNSDDSPTYDMLYGAYVEMHKEFKKIAKQYADRKY